ncbi:phosphatase PAP2 family protein [Paenibacillus sp. N1-5-1-14]|uniref:phosphatase PAP2 family protein n=1 Tax=Paenibacillus radicibacter TaxID=2972488 RepID=UPI002159B0FF|nr:phosphatase PAP2 family protein [Paenibacillus radicibacter]MCR8644523.1 phosphatase PAP2 family protein [Paenibacillus radicibacter]
MKARRKKRKLAAYYPLLWMLAIPVLNICYGLLNQDRGNVSSLLTSFDVNIQFVPGFIIPYLLWYPFIIGMLVVFFMKNKTAYYRTLLSLCMGLVLCYITYFIFQTTVLRPSIDPNQGILMMLVNFVYQTDAPYNCFPSIHVLSSYVILKGLADCPQAARAIRIGTWVMSWLIIASTLFVKQHVWADVVGAIVLVEVVYYAVKRWIPARESKSPARAQIFNNKQKSLT